MGSFLFRLFGMYEAKQLIWTSQEYLICDLTGARSSEHGTRRRYRGAMPWRSTQAADVSHTHPIEHRTRGILRTIGSTCGLVLAKAYGEQTAIVLLSLDGSTEVKHPTAKHWEQ